MNKSQALRRLRAIAARVGATIEDDSGGDSYILQCVAPDGKRWIESDGHHLVVSCFRGNPTWLAEAVHDGCERMRAGLRDATPDELDESEGV